MLVTLGFIYNRLDCLKQCTKWVTNTAHTRSWWLHGKRIARFRAIGEILCGNQTDRFQTFSRTHHINQEPRVLWIIFGEEKRSRKSPSFSCLGKASGSSGISLPLILATLARLLLASDTRPFFRSHRTDSGVMLKRNKRKKKLKTKNKNAKWRYYSGFRRTIRNMRFLLCPNDHFCALGFRYLFQAGE